MKVFLTLRLEIKQSVLDTIHDGSLVRGGGGVLTGGAFTG